MTTWTDDKEQELFEAQETISELLEDGHSLMVAVFDWINGADNGAMLEKRALALEQAIRKASR